VTTPFERALRDELVAAAEREPHGRPHRQPHRARRIGLGVIAAVAALLTALALTTAHPATADVEVRTRGSRVEVVLTGDDPDPAALVRAVRKAGFAAALVEVPTGPSRVGRYLGYSGDDDIEDLDPTALDGSARSGFSVPKGWAGHLVVHEGRLARTGEPYGASTDAFAPGEPLHCSGLRGATVASLAHRLTDLHVRVQTLGAGSGPQLALADAVASDFASWRVTGALTVSADEVVLRAERAPTVAPGREPGC
jgi:hypothetical protein